ncbi:hypothetical protein [Pseudarthrobacter sulfonivorans]|uniref:hypothetical protein n=1 Tax=Pseudarthrobacter sulfonivorans TaxID=121292 RepID=UPI0028670A82|nr:hypothetical protein [Pseudarthrobacter sulfonivorans]MDR6416200.1 hypothetical protein [Pseudarthrobacter sulfonivorans]
MNSLFFWIIILSFLIPMAMRMYRKSVNKRNQGQGFPGGYPGQFPGNGFPGHGQNPGQQNRQPRDGYTQQDYMNGGFRQIMSPQPLPPSQPLPPMQPVPPMDQQYPGQQFPGQQFPPYGQPQQYGQPDQHAEAPKAPAAPATPPPPSAPQGFRARKLAELDQQYSNGELAMEEYMKRRSEIMNG